MKRILSIIGLTAVAVVFLATTYRTENIDGSNGFASDEVFSISTTGGNAYFTWDANYLYFAISHADADEGDLATFIYFDTDPQLTPTSGTGTTNGYTWGGTMSLPFTANYCVVWKNYFGADYIEVRRWDGSSWTQTASATSTQLIVDGETVVHFAIGTDYREVKIAKSIIGNPSQIYVASFTEQQTDHGRWGINYRYFFWPSDAGTEGDRASSTSISHWYGFTLISGVSPNSSEHKDQSLPAQFVSLVAITGNSKVTLVWETGSEFNNAGFEIYRKAQDETDFKYIAGYQTNPELRGLGTSSHGKRYTYTDENVKVGATYVYKIYAVDFNGNRQEFGSITANVVAEIPNKYVLYQNYPNPFNPGTEIRFDLPKSGNVKLEIFNSLGEKVAVLYDGFMEAGYGKVVRWNANGFPSGVYYYRLTADEFVDVKKMVLMK